jgi:hypothetical protein
MSADLNWIEERLDAYLNGTLSPTERSVFDSLVATDPTARGRLEEAQRVVVALRALPAQPPPEGFASKMAVAVGELPRRSAVGTVLHSFANFPRSAAWSIAAGLAVAVLWVVFGSWFTSLGESMPGLSENLLPSLSFEEFGSSGGGGLVLMAVLGVAAGVWFGRRGLLAVFRLIES